MKTLPRTRSSKLALLLPWIAALAWTLSVARTFAEPHSILAGRSTAREKLGLANELSSEIIVGFSFTHFALAETNGTVSISVIRQGGLDQEVRVWAMAGPAEPFHSSRLYTPTTNELVFPLGATQTEFVISTQRDYERRGAETVALWLEPISVGVTLSPDVAQLRLLDRDMSFHLEGPFSASESAGILRGRVFRDSESPLAVELLVRAEDGSAKAGIDYELRTDRLTFPAGSRIAEFEVLLRNDDRVQGARAFTLRFESPRLGMLWRDRAEFVIFDDESPSGPGAVGSEYNEATTFDSTVSSIMTLPDGRLLVAGSFSTYQGEPAPNVVILRVDGTRDPTFDCPGITRPPGFPTTFGGRVGSAIPLGNGNFLAVGSFQSFGGLPRTNGVILGPNGGVVPEITADFNQSPVWLWPLPGGGVIGASDVASRFNGEPAPKVFRLTAEGRLDPSFVGGTNCLVAPSRLLALPDGSLYADGGTWKVGSRRDVRLIRLLPNGLPDPTFEAPLLLLSNRWSALSLLVDGSLLAWPGRMLGGAAVDPVFGDGIVRTVHAVLADGRMLATEAKQGLPHLVRLLGDGTPDGEFDVRFDRGFQGLAVGPDESITVIGAFSSVNHEPRDNIVRLLGDDPGAPSRIRWHGRRFGVLRSAGIARAPLLRTGKLTEVERVRVRATDGEATAGVDFVGIDHEVVFQPGERVKLVEIQLLPRASFNDPQFGLHVSGPSVLPGGDTARVAILDPSGTIEFESESQVLLEGPRPAEVAFVRTGGLAYPAAARSHGRGSVTQMAANLANFRVADLAAVLPTGVSFAAGESRKVMPIFPQDDPYIEGTETLELVITNATPGLIGSQSKHILSLIDNDDSSGPGENLWPGTELHRRNPAGYWSSEPRWTTNGWRRGPTARRDDGSLDASTPLPTGRSDRVLDVYADGRLLVATSASDPRRQVIIHRLLPDNQPDPNFSSQTLSYSGANGAGQTLQFTGCALPDGGALVGMGVFEGTSTPLDLVRLDSMGQLVAGFDGSQLVLLSSRDPHARWQVAALPGGRFLVGGAVSVRQVLSGEPFIRRDLIRLTPDGFPDRTFMTIFGPAGSASVRGFQVRTDGSSVVVGQFDAVNAVPRRGVVALQADGEVDLASQPDPGDWAADAGLNAVGLCDDGGYLVAGLSKGGHHQVMRLNEDGRPAANFQAPEFNDRVFSLFAFPDGRFVVTGAFDQANRQWRGGVAWFDPLGNLQAERPLTIRDRVRGSNGYLRLESRTRVNAMIQSSADLLQWDALRALRLEPGVSEVTIPDNESEAEFWRVVW